MSRIAFPVAVVAYAATGIFSPSAESSRRADENYFSVSEKPISAPLSADGEVNAPTRDTVIYPVAGYKLRRTLSLEEITVRDTSSTEDFADSLGLAIDTLPPRLSPRDSLKALLDSTLWDKLDSIYLADSTARAKAAFAEAFSPLARRPPRSGSMMITGRPFSWA